MTIISVKTFGGVSPRTPARYLADVQAQTAKNCQPWLGPLRSLPGTSKVRNLVKSAVQSIYRFGQDINEDGRYWFEFQSDVDIVRGQIAGDTEERTYFTGDGVPKKTNNTLALSGGSAYPIAAYTLAVPRPASAPTASVSGAGNGVPEDRVYIFTYVTGWGEESQPSNASNQAAVSFGQSVSLSGLLVPPAGAHNIATKRIYRSVAGSSSAEYLFVAEIPAAQTTYTDTKLAEDLGEVCPSIDWAAPPDGLKGLCSGPNGMGAGFVGHDVYLWAPFRPFAFPVKYMSTVSFPVVGLSWMDTTLAILTTGKPSFYQGTDPGAMAEVHSDITQACVSKRSIVSMNGMVLYASPDGLVKLSPGESGVITEKLFAKENWQALKPETIAGYSWEGKYVGFFDSPTLGKGGFIFDPKAPPETAFSFHDVWASAGYTDLLRDTLYLVVGNELHAWYAGAGLTYEWRSKKFSMPQPIWFACAKVRAEAYPVTLQVVGELRDTALMENRSGTGWTTTISGGQMVHTRTVTSSDPFRLPCHRVLSLDFKLTGAGEVFSVAIAQSIGELADV
jgi:hypothetical protein